MAPRNAPSEQTPGMQSLRLLHELSLQQSLELELEGGGKTNYIQQRVEGIHTAFERFPQRFPEFLEQWINVGYEMLTDEFYDQQTPDGRQPDAISDDAKGMLDEQQSGNPSNQQTTQLLRDQKDGQFLFESQRDQKLWALQLAVEELLRFGGIRCVQYDSSASDSQKRGLVVHNQRLLQRMNYCLRRAMRLWRKADNGIEQFALEARRAIQRRKVNC